MKIVPLAEVKDHFSAYVDESRESPIVVTRNGRPVAMLISITEEEDLDSLLLAHNPRFVQLLEEARERVRVTSRVSLANFRKQIEKEDVVDAAVYQVERDPLIGLFSGPPELSEQAEIVLEQATQEHSGWTWKS